MDKYHKSLHERAVRLIEGGIVQVDGHAVRAIKVLIDMCPCDVCDIDCLCRRILGNEMAFLCEEVNKIGKNSYYLKLVRVK